MRIIGGLVKRCESLECREKNLIKAGAVSIVQAPKRAILLSADYATNRVDQRNAVARGEPAVQDPFNRSRSDDGLTARGPPQSDQAGERAIRHGGGIHFR